MNPRVYEKHEYFMYCEKGINIIVKIVKRNQYNCENSEN